MEGWVDRPSLEEEEEEEEEEEVDPLESRDVRRFIPAAVSRLASSWSLSLFLSLTIHQPTRGVGRHKASTFIFLDLSTFYFLLYITTIPPPQSCLTEIIYIATAAASPDRTSTLELIASLLPSSEQQSWPAGWLAG